MVQTEPAEPPQSYRRRSKITAACCLLPRLARGQGAGAGPTQHRLGSEEKGKRPREEREPGLLGPRPRTPFSTTAYTIGPVHPTLHRTATSIRKLSKEKEDEGGTL